MHRICVLVLTLLAVSCVLSGCRSTQALRPAEQKVDAAKETEPQTSPSSADVCFDSKNVKTENQRAWCLWSLVTQDVEVSKGQPQPLWSTWEEKPKGGLGPYSCRPNLHGKETGDEVSTFEQAFVLTEGTTPLDEKTNSSGGLGQVYFNLGAMEEICGLAPPVVVTLRKQMDTITAATPLTLDQKPSHMAAPLSGHYPVIVKTFWVVVETAMAKAGPFPVWDSKQPARPASDFREKWPELTINLADEDSCKFTAPATYDSPIVLPGSCFHFVKLTDAQVDHTPSTVPHFGYGRDTTYVLLAVNIAAKGPRGWTWQTFNWDAQQASTSQRQPNPYALSRPEWARYAMTTQDAQHRTIYSPYLEMKVNTPSTSDCGSCHVHAVYYMGSSRTLAADQARVADCMYGKFKAGDNPDQTRAQIKCKVQHKWFTDSIWSLANSNAPSANQ